MQPAPDMRSSVLYHVRGGHTNDGKPFMQESGHDPAWRHSQLFSAGGMVFLGLSGHDERSGWRRLRWQRNRDESRDKSIFHSEGCEVRIRQATRRI
ncbi:MAG: hypothetical protein OXC91_10080 [Rhodobacteraceae bacterium]|nr:hypothetical protein [Paracoccaceae bacterium]